MDMVYQRARWCVGLIDSTIPSQTQLDAVASVLGWASANDPTQRALHLHAESGLTGDTVADQLMDFLELFASDTWNTRAWILQEAFSASGRLVLTIRTAPSIAFRGWSSLGVDPNMMSGVFSISMSDMTSLIQVSKAFLHMCARFHTSTGIAISSAMLSQVNESRMFKILNDLEYIHPWPSATANRHAYMYAVGGPHFGARKACNAATAVTFLRSRFNHRPADRLAILANLADYEVRLDTVKVEQRFKSLGVCLFVLAYLNGDLSLLTPGIYQRAKVQAPIEGPHWILPATEIIDSANATYLRAGLAQVLRNPRRFNLSESGATMPAYVWNVNRKVNLKFIRRKWEQFWKKWTCITMTMKLRENESIEDFQARQQQIHNLLAKGQHNSEALKTLLDGEKPLDWDNIGFGNQDTSTNVSKILSTARLEQDKSVQWMIGNLFREILEYLCDVDEVPLANSIWHTIRTNCVNGNTESNTNWRQSHWDALPDNVIDLLLTDEFIALPFRQMQLDYNNRGTFNQVWMIDRIMRDGYLWVGNYVSVASNPQSGDTVSKDPRQEPDVHQKDTDGNTEENTERKPGTEHDSTVTKRRPPLFHPTCKEALFMSALLHSNPEYTDALKDGIRMAPRARHNTATSTTLLPILALQTFKLLCAITFRSDCFRISRGIAAKRKAIAAAAAAAVPAGDDLGKENGSVDISDEDYPTNLLQGVFMSHLLLRNTDAETQDKKLCERVAAFDVDGPCMVATAYDVDMERLPRSAVRFMDTAWVVEVVHRVNEVERKIAESPVIEREDVDDDAGDYHGDATFRVLNRVRGAWEIMEENWHEYEFV